MSDPATYFLPAASHDVDLRPWADMLPEAPRILRVTLFAEIVVADRDGAVHLLEAAAGMIERIAETEEEFWRRIRLDEDGWQLRPLVDRCREAGKLLREGECYAFTTLPLFGGEYVVENVWTCPWREWFAFTGEIHVQTKDLPEGARIRIKVVD